MSTFIDDYEAGYAAGEKVGYEVGVKETDEYNAYQHGYATGFFKGYMSAKKEYEPKHGRWIDRGKNMCIRWKCSECGRKDTHIYNYCPDCGALMTDEVEEETLEMWDLDGSPTRYIKARRDEVEE